MDFFQIKDSSGHHVWMTGATLWITLALVALTMLLIWITPKITRAIPAPLLAITLVAALVIIFDINVLSVGDLSSVKGGLPTFAIPIIPFTFETLYIILPYALILGSIGLIESLLTLNLVGDITGKRWRQPGMSGPRRCKYCHWPLWRHGWLRYDWAIND